MRYFTNITAPPPGPMKDAAFFFPRWLLRLLATWVLTVAISLTGIHDCALAGPPDPDNFDSQAGGLIDVKPGAYVEGSVRSGGLQPDYIIDVHEEPLRGLLARAANIKRLNLDFWDKVGLVVELIRDTFQHTDYHNPYYRDLMKTYREQNADIPLSQYLACRAGVCRELSLVLHFALKAAGIPNHYAYGYASMPNQDLTADVSGDHAFVVVVRDGTQWVVDAYRRQFNGFRLQDLMSEEGVTQNSQHAPIAVTMPGRRRVLHLNQFPRVYNPRPTSKTCTSLFQ